jgi:phosphopantothenoylcysteine decarboxylase / phosphopantothenate---cysteine ligase
MKKNKILLGITGCIACYKSAELTRFLVKQGFDVKVILTESAKKFVTPLLFKTLSKNQVYSELFLEDSQWCPEHISLSDWADLLVIAPASANIINKIAVGIADDLLTSTVMAFDKNILLFPTMNERMYKNEILTENINKLKKINRFNFSEPETGELACGTSGIGRMPKIEVIVDKIKEQLNL